MNIENPEEVQEVRGESKYSAQNQSQNPSFNLYQGEINARYCIVDTKFGKMAVLFEKQPNISTRRENKDLITYYLFSLCPIQGSQWKACRTCINKAHELLKLDDMSGTPICGVVQDRSKDYIGVFVQNKSNKFFRQYEEDDRYKKYPHLHLVPFNQGGAHASDEHCFRFQEVCDKYWLLVKQLIIKCFSEGTPEEVYSSYKFILSVIMDKKVNPTETFKQGAEWFKKVAKYVVNKGLKYKKPLHLAQICVFAIGLAFDKSKSLSKYHQFNNSVYPLAESASDSISRGEDPKATIQRCIKNMLNGYQVSNKPITKQQLDVAKSELFNARASIMTVNNMPPKAEENYYPFASTSAHASASAFENLEKKVTSRNLRKLSKLASYDRSPASLMQLPSCGKVVTTVSPNRAIYTFFIAGTKPDLCGCFTKYHSWAETRMHILPTGSTIVGLLRMPYLAWRSSDNIAQAILVVKDTPENTRGYRDRKWAFAEDISTDYHYLKNVYGQLTSQMADCTGQKIHGVMISYSIKNGSLINPEYINLFLNGRKVTINRMFV
tara:strand:- start:330 stop:1979 length:1650 start_codon:yes stop_codon:yes gene_type:complete